MGVRFRQWQSETESPDLLEVLGACLALGLLSAYLALVGRGLAGVLLASVLVAFLLFVTSELDRPTHGPIEIPDAVLTDLYESMQEPPAASAPRHAEG